MELIFEFAEDFGWKGPIPVIFSVSPDRNWSCRTLRTGIKRAERFGYLERLKISEVNIKGWHEHTFESEGGGHQQNWPSYWPQSRWYLWFFGCFDSEVLWRVSFEIRVWVLRVHNVFHLGPQIFFCACPRLLTRDIVAFGRLPFFFLRRFGPFSWLRKAISTAGCNHVIY